MSPQGLYLDLLKRVLTDTIYEPEPRVDSPDFVEAFLRHYVRGRARTMVPRVRLDNLQECVSDVLDRQVPGDLIETGVWRGGTTIFMRAMLAAFAIADRKVWVADSFQGLPSPDPARFPIEARAHASHTMVHEYKHFAATAQDVRANFAAYDLLDEQVCFLEGWFKDTLPTAPISRLAVLRLDGDYYESTIDALTHLYPKVSDGGYVIVDDYGENMWTYCRKAVDEFRKSHGIASALIKVDSKCYYWKKAS